MESNTEVTIRFDSTIRTALKNGRSISGFIVICCCNLCKAGLYLSYF